MANKTWYVITTREKHGWFYNYSKEDGGRFGECFFEHGMFNLSDMRIVFIKVNIHCMYAELV